MKVEINNPDYFTLIHRQSGRKINTYNSVYISYDDEKFEIYKKPEQTKIF